MTTVSQLRGPSREHLAWPFFDSRLVKYAATLDAFAAETAQAVIDRAVQTFGGRGVRSGEAIEQLYRKIRALRIYEGATEVQKLIIGRDVLKVA